MPRRVLSALVIAAVLLSGAAAGDVAYPGCRLAWNYSPDQAHLISNFAFAMGDGKVVFRPTAEARVAPCSDLPLKDGANTVQLRAYSAVRAQASDWATLTFTYSPRIQAPGGFATKF